MTPPGHDAPASPAIPSWRSLCRPLVLILVAVVLAVSAWTAVANYLVVARDPEAPVDTYLSRLEGGSSRQVLAPLLVGGGDDLAQLLPNSVYRGAANRPVGHEFVGTEVRGEHAEVTVDIHLGDGSTVRRSYGVDQVTAWGPFNDTWRLHRRDETTVEVRFPGPLDALAVNGEKVRPDAESTSAPDASRPQARAWRFEALPGRYDIALPDDSYLLATKHAAADISIRDARPAVTEELSVTASPRLWEEAEREVQQRLAACESVLRFDLSACPVPRELARAASSAQTERTPSPGSGELPAGVSAVRWEVTSRPTLLLEQDDDDPLTFHAAHFRATEATVTWLEHGRQKKGTVRFGIDVTARTTGEQLSTEVRLRSMLTGAEK